ncbi:MAG: sugar porter family MFS transporter [Thermodesulfobacteriota bacterium]
MNSGKKSGIVILTSAIAALAGLLLGYDTGSISGALGFISDEFRLDTVGKGSVVSIVLIGGIIGAFINGVFADRLGRKLTVQGAALLFIAGAAGSALSPSAGALLVSRFILGLALGAVSASAPLYIAEISPASGRGRLVTYFQLAITIGILLGYFIDRSLTVSGDWRFMLGTSVIPATVLLSGMFILPPSPRWLIKMGREEAARKTLLKISGGDEALTDSELNDIRHVLSMETNGGFAYMLRPPVSRALVTGVGLFLIQQFVGINTVMYYAPSLFREAGMESHDSAILATVSVGVMNVLATFIAVWLIDKAGRKPLLYAGLTGMLVSLTAIGGVFALGGSGGGLETGKATVITVWIYIACFAFSLGPVPWIIMTEIFPLNVRGRAVSIATMSSWGANLIVSFSFLPLLEAAGAAYTYWLYALVSLLGIVFVWRLVPETKGLSLEEIEERLLAGKRRF